MRSLIPLSMIFGFSTGEDALTMLYSDHVVRGKTFEEVYGKVAAVEDTTPYYERPAARDMRFAGDYFKHRSQEMCDFPIEILLVQDATNSFNDDIVNMKQTQLQLMIDALSTSHPGSAFAAMSFRDKPLWPLGEIGDYCTRFGSPLSLTASTVIDDYAQLILAGGGDPPEASFHALVAATQSNTPGWGLISIASRLIVVVTDAAPHFDGDGFNVYNLPPFSGHFDEANNEQQCVQEYYPGPATVREAIQSRQVYLGSLVYDGSYDSHLPIESWRWFNRYINQSDNFVFDIENDSSNFWERLGRIITELEEVECGLSTSTPPPETDTVAPTTAATVTPIGSIETPTEAETEAPTEAETEASTEAGSEECPPCPPCDNAPCDPCCREGVLIKLAYRPAKLHLEVEN